MNDFSTLDFYGNEAAPQHAFRTRTEMLPNGEYEFEIADAALDRINVNDICRVGLRTPNGVVFEHVYWLNQQKDVNDFLAELAALGYPAHTWGNGPGKTPLSQAIPAAVAQLPGKRFRAIKTSQQGTKDPTKTFHDVRVTGPIGGRPMPSLTPAAPAAPTPATASVPVVPTVPVPSAAYGTVEIPFERGVVLTLVPLKADVPPEVRLRAPLKYALRACLWRCVDHREVDHDGH